MAAYIDGMCHICPTNGVLHSDVGRTSPPVPAVPIVGWLCNVVAMHFYPLTKEKMEEIQAEIGRIKAEAAAKQA